MPLSHLHRLVHIAHILRLDVGVLLARPHKLWEGGEQPLNPDSAHVHELPGDQGCMTGPSIDQVQAGYTCRAILGALKSQRFTFARLGHHRRSEDHHLASPSLKASSSPLAWGSVYIMQQHITKQQSTEKRSTAMDPARDGHRIELAVREGIAQPGFRYVKTRAALESLHQPSPKFRAVSQLSPGAAAANAQPAGRPSGGSAQAGNALHAAGQQALLHALHAAKSIYWGKASKACL